MGEFSWSSGYAGSGLVPGSMGADVGGVAGAADVDSGTSGLAFRPLFPSRVVPSSGPARDAAFAAIDENGDGVITRAEWQRAMAGDQSGNSPRSGFRPLGGGGFGGSPAAASSTSTSFGAWGLSKSKLGESSTSAGSVVGESSLLTSSLKSETGDLRLQTTGRSSPQDLRVPSIGGFATSSSALSRPPGESPRVELGGRGFGSPMSPLEGLGSPRVPGLSTSAADTGQVAQFGKQPSLGYRPWPAPQAPDHTLQGSSPVTLGDAGSADTVGRWPSSGSAAFLAPAPEQKFESAKTSPHWSSVRGPDAVGAHDHALRSGASSPLWPANSPAQSRGQSAEVPLPAAVEDRNGGLLPSAKLGGPASPQDQSSSHVASSWSRLGEQGAADDSTSAAGLGSAQLRAPSGSPRREVAGAAFGAVDSGHAHLDGRAPPSQDGQAHSDTLELNQQQVHLNVMGLVRDQTMVLAQNLQKLEEEVKEMKASRSEQSAPEYRTTTGDAHRSQDGDALDSKFHAFASELERKFQEQLSGLGGQLRQLLQDAVSRERQDREAAQASALAEVDSVSSSYREELSALRRQFQEQLQDSTSKRLGHQDTEVTFNDHGSPDMHEKLASLQELHAAFSAEKLQLHSNLSDLKDKLKLFEELRDDNARQRSAMEELIVRQDKELRETFNAEKLQVQAHLVELQRDLQSVQAVGKEASSTHVALQDLIHKQDKELRQTFDAEKFQVQKHLDEVREKLKGTQGARDDQSSSRRPAAEYMQDADSVAGSASLQPAMDGLEGRLQKEIKDRMQESQRLWSAIENHTHDLDVSTLRLDTSMLLMEEPPPPVDCTQPSGFASTQAGSAASSVGAALEPSLAASQIPWRSTLEAPRGLSPLRSGGSAEGPPMNS